MLGWYGVIRPTVVSNQSADWINYSPTSYLINIWFYTSVKMQHLDINRRHSCLLVCMLAFVFVWMCPLFFFSLLWWWRDGELSDKFILTPHLKIRKHDLTRRHKHFLGEFFLSAVFVCWPAVGDAGIAVLMSIILSLRMLLASRPLAVTPLGQLMAEISFLSL